MTVQQTTRRTILTATGAAIALAACGGGGSDFSNPTPAPAPTPAQPPAPGPGPSMPARPAIADSSIPRLRGLGVQPQKELVDVTSAVFKRYQYVDDSGCNVLRLFMQPWDFVSGAPILPASPLMERVQEDLKQWSQLIPWALERNIRVVLTMDLSIGWPLQATWPENIRSFWRDADAQREFVAAWVALAKQFKGKPGIVFDLLNEPHGVVPEDVDGNHQWPKRVWNQLYPKAIEAIRAVESDRWIMVEPIWGAPDNFADLVHVNMPRLLYSFHFYSPHEFTYQGTGEWSASRGITYPGRAQSDRWSPSINWDRAQLQLSMEGARAFAITYGARMVVGELGCGREAEPESRTRWAADALGICEELGFDWLFFRFEGWGVSEEFHHGWALENSPKLEPLVLDYFAKNKVAGAG